MKVYIVGTGAEGENSLTKEAKTAIDSAGLLIGAERMLKPYVGSGKEVFAGYRPEMIAEKLSSCEHSAAAVLMSGDCGFFSGAKKLLPLLADHEVRIIPGISSAAMFCSRLGISYEDMKFVTLHGRSSNIAVNVRLNERCFFLLGGEMTAARVCRVLCSYGLSDVTVHIGTDLGYEGETVTSGRAEELVETDTSGLTVMIVENSRALGHIPSGIDDEEFRRSTIPMTKSEVRCVAVAKLGICRNSVVWDIGCGTGSVSVEAAYRCPDGTVCAFDKDPGAAELTAENARLHGCDNIQVTAGSCPEALAGAAAPDKVFIGGSSGDMDGIFEAVHGKAPAADIAVTAVSLETLRQTVSCFERYGAAPQIVQISVTRTKRVGSHTMLQGQNPVFVIWGRLS